MSEIKDGNTIIGVPERIEEKLKMEENCLCCECGIKETITYRTKEEYSFNSITKKIQPLVKVTKDKNGVYHIKFFEEGEGLKSKTECFNNYLPITDTLTGLPRMG